MSRGSLTLGRYLMGLLVMLALPSAAALAASFRTIALSGDTAPDTGDLVFDYFRAPTINNAGEVMVHGYLPRVGDVSWQNDNGFWLVDSLNQWRKIARAGDDVPGLGAGVLFSGISPDPLQFEPSGVVYRAQVKGTNIDTTNDYLYARFDANGTTSVLAREGRAAHGVANATYGTLDSKIGADATGRITYDASLKGTGISTANDDGIWADLGAGQTIIGREGSQVPGETAGVTFTPFFRTPWLSGGGKVQVPFYMWGASYGNTKRMVAATFDGSQYTIQAQTLQQVPGEPAGVTFDFIAGQTINGSGQVALAARYTGSGITSSNASSIWLTATNGTPQPAFRGGETVIPGTGGATFLDQDAADFLVFILNDAGDIAGRYILQGNGVTSQNDRCLVMRAANGDLSMIAREGDQAAGLPTGVLWGNYIDRPALNNNGVVAFTGNLTGAGVEYTNDGGLWIWDAAQGARLIAREGDLFEAAANDWRTIQYISFRATDQDGDRYTSVNDSGEVAFALRFTDNTGGTYTYDTRTTPLMGDVNGDTIIDLNDIIMTLNVVATSTAATVSKSADVNMDGKIGNEEAIYILRIIAGID